MGEKGARHLFLDRELAVRIKPGFGCSGGTLLSQHSRVIYLVACAITKWNKGGEFFSRKNAGCRGIPHKPRCKILFFCWRPAQPAKQGIIILTESDVYCKSPLPVIPGVIFKRRFYSGKRGK
jgi:hypothetical protein